MSHKLDKTAYNEAKTKRDDAKVSLGAKVKPNMSIQELTEAVKCVLEIIS